MGITVNFNLFLSYCLASMRKQTNGPREFVKLDIFRNSRINKNIRLKQTKKFKPIKKFSFKDCKWLSCNKIIDEVYSSYKTVFDSQEMLWLISKVGWRGLETKVVNYWGETFKYTWDSWNLLFLKHFNHLYVIWASCRRNARTFHFTGTRLFGDITGGTLKFFGHMMKQQKLFSSLDWVCEASKLETSMSQWQWESQGYHWSVLAVSSSRRHNSIGRQDAESEDEPSDGGASGTFASAAATWNKTKLICWTWPDNFHPFSTKYNLQG